MSLGIRRITQLDLPLLVENKEFKCPACGGPVVVRAVRSTLEDGRAEVVLLGCKRHKEHDNTVDWGGHLGDGFFKWFNRFYRYQPLAAETLAKKRSLKWRRAA